MVAPLGPRTIVCFNALMHIVTLSHVSCKLYFDFTFNALTRFYSFPTRFLLVSTHFYSFPTRFYSFLLVALFTKRAILVMKVNHGTRAR